MYVGKKLSFLGKLEKKIEEENLLDFYGKG